MKFCLNVINFSPRFGDPPDVRDLIAAAAQAGFDSIGLDLGTLGHAETLGVTLGDVRRALDAHGLSCFEVCSLLVGRDTEATLDNARRIAEAAGALGAGWILTLVTVPAGPETTAQVARCAELAGGVAARLAVEFYPMAQVRSIDGALDLCRAVGLDRARILMDTWHVFRGPDGWEEVEALPLDALAYVQFDDALPMECDDIPLETTTRRVMPGEGEFPLERFARTLTARGFDGTVSVEVIGRRYQGMDPRRYAADAMAATRPYWS